MLKRLVEYGKTYDTQFDEWNMIKQNKTYYGKMQLMINNPHYDKDYDTPRW